MARLPINFSPSKTKDRRNSNSKGDDDFKNSTFHQYPLMSFRTSTTLHFSPIIGHKSVRTNPCYKTATDLVKWIPGDLVKPWLITLEVLDQGRQKSSWSTETGNLGLNFSNPSLPIIWSYQASEKGGKTSAQYPLMTEVWLIQTNIEKNCKKPDSKRH